MFYTFLFLLITLYVSMSQNTTLFLVASLFRSKSTRVGGWLSHVTRKRIFDGSIFDKSPSSQKVHLCLDRDLMHIDTSDLVFKRHQKLYF
jgi:hypothetical protein